MANQKIILQIIQIALCVLLVIVVILQNRNSGLGNIFGGTGTSVHREKRGMEKYLWYATIVISVLFVLGTILDLSMK